MEQNMNFVYISWEVLHIWTCVPEAVIKGRDK